MSLHTINDVKRKNNNELWIKQPTNENLRKCTINNKIIINGGRKIYQSQI